MSNPYFIREDRIIRKSDFWKGVAMIGKVVEVDSTGRMLIKWENEDIIRVCCNEDSIIHADSTYQGDGHFSSPSRSRNVRCYFAYYRKGTEQ